MTVGSGEGKGVRERGKRNRIIDRVEDQEYCVHALLRQSKGPLDAPPKAPLCFYRLNAVDASQPHKHIL